MLVLGDREAEEGQVNVRLRTGEQRGTMPIGEFIAYAQGVVQQKALI
jgi:threonyl-tRNA synthetase